MPTSIDYALICRIPGGGKFRVEFTVDHCKQEGTVFILGADEKTLTRPRHQSTQVKSNQALPTL